MKQLIKGKLPQCSRVIDEATRTQCSEDAAGVVGVNVYPHPKMLEFYADDRRPLSNITVNCPCCRKHAEEFDVKTFTSGDDFTVVIRAIEKQTGTAVDRDACKAFLVPYFSNDYFAFAMALERRDQAARRQAAVNAS